MSTQFNSNFNDTIPISDEGVAVALATDVESTWTVPGTPRDSYRALFSYNQNDYVWVALNTTAVAPAPGTVTDTYKQEMRPDYRYVQGGDVLHFIANVGTPQFGISLLKLPS